MQISCHGKQEQSCSLLSVKDVAGQNNHVGLHKVLVPYLQGRAVGAPCYLFLDHFPAHWTTPVQDKLIQLGITPYKIPAGCTSLVQPIDIGIGKRFKDCVGSKWWDWMHAQGANRSTFVSAS